MLSLLLGGSVPSEIYNVIITDNEGISAELDHSKFIDNLEDYSDTGVVCYSLNPYKISAGKGRAVKSIEYVVTSQDAPEYGKSAVISEIQMYVDSNWFPNQ